MEGKTLINAVGDTVNESLIGCILTYPHLELHKLKRVVLKPKWSEPYPKVSIISGGGSGHEPFPAGFVGTGMLAAGVCGSIYASPPSSHVFHAIQCVSSDYNPGCFVIIPNYTGDCLNFGLAIEKAKSLNLTVSHVVVGDDCSIPEEELGRAGRRGLPGIILVIKVAGAMAERGHCLEDVQKFAELVTHNLASCSVGLTACTIPGQGKMFEIADDEIEFGQGLHGEAGYKRMKLSTAAKIASLMLEPIVERLKLSKGDSVVVLVNNFGALSQLEQGIIVKEVVTQLQIMEILPLRVYAGVLMTSLNSAGVHVSVLKLPEGSKTALLNALDDKTDAPKWPGCSYSLPSNFYKIPHKEQKYTKELSGPALDNKQQVLLEKCLRDACKEIINQEKVINELDRGCGDGDCGTTHKHLAEGILEAIGKLTLSHPSSLLSELGNIAEERMGGTSGAIYSLMFTSAANSLALFASTDNWIKTWHWTWRAGVKGIKKYSKAKLGDKTILDVLDPSVKELKNHKSLHYAEAAKKVAAVAIESAEKTKFMVPRAGRASYVKQTEYLERVDAGAFAASVWINAIAKAL